MCVRIINGFKNRGCIAISGRYRIPSLNAAPSLRTSCLSRHHHGQQKRSLIAVTDASRRRIFAIHNYVGASYRYDSNSFWINSTNLKLKSVSIDHPSFFKTFSYSNVAEQNFTRVDQGRETKIAHTMKATTPSARSFSVTASERRKGDGKNESFDEDDIGTITFQKIPQLPVVGSMVPWYSGTPLLDMKRIYDFFPALREKYGTFYSMGFPGIGDGLFGHVVVLGDPNEMLKVLRHEGSYPSGFIQQDWGIIKWLRDVGSPIVNDKDIGFFGNGESWKRLRTFMQTDLLNPVAAKGYVPGMLQAAKLASLGAPYCSGSMKQYVQRCSLDLFSTVMFGELINNANPTSSSQNKDGVGTGIENEDDVNAKFCSAVQTIVSEETIQMIMSPYQIVMNKMLNTTTSTFQSFEDKASVARDIARQKILSFVERKKKGELTDVERASYLGHAMERQADESSNISIDEMVDLSMLLLVAAVDTTSSLLHWTLVHLALNPKVQQTLYDELEKNITCNGEGGGGELIADMMDKKNTPYLHAVIRENHRLTPAIFVTLGKKNVVDDITIHNRTFPKGTMFLFDAYSTGIDSNYVDDCFKFQPERWLDDAVNQRKGTPSEMIDHPLFRDPFSHGARKCPGSRAANYEVLCMISQLVLDWKISIKDPNIKTLQDVEYAQTATIHPTNIQQFQFLPR